MTLTDRIVIDSAIQEGKPVIRGTRASVEVILGSLVGAMNYDEIEREYEISKEDILACPISKSGEEILTRKQTKKHIDLLKMQGEPIKEPIKSAKGFLKGSNFSSEKYTPLKKEEKELDL